jgi:hypothetical protein
MRSGWYDRRLARSTNGTKTNMPIYEISLDLMNHTLIYWLERDCCSAETMSFHSVEFLENLALFQIRKALLQKPQMSDDDLKDMFIEKWPKEWGDLRRIFASPAGPNERTRGLGCYFGHCENCLAKSMKTLC